MTTLQENTYTLLKKVPRGRVTTYKAIAHALHTKAYRAIGQFMRLNTHAPAIPCHRVVASDGSLGGYSGGIAKKIRLLTSEGIMVKNNKIVDFTTVYYHF